MLYVFLEVVILLLVFVVWAQWREIRRLRGKVEPLREIVWALLLSDERSIYGDASGNDLSLAEGVWEVSGIDLPRTGDGAKAADVAWGDHAGRGNGGDGGFGNRAD